MDKKRDEWGARPYLKQIAHPQSEDFKTIEFIGTPLYLDEQFLRQKYEVERLSIAQISKLLASSESTVQKYLRRYEIIRRPAFTKNRNRLKYGEAWRSNQVVEHKGEVKTIKKMRLLREQGFSYWKIADILNAMNVPTKTGRGKWHARSVQNLLDSNQQPLPSYHGTTK